MRMPVPHTTGVCPYLDILHRRSSVASLSIFLALLPSPLPAHARDFADVTTPPLEGLGDSFGVSWADADGDGDADLYVANGSAANRMFRNDGGLSFADVTDAVLGDPSDCLAGVWGDADGDGDLDLFLALDGAPNRFLRNEGGLTFAETAVGLESERSGRSAAWSDYDLDGDLDLYVVNAAFEPNALYRNDGAAGFADVTTPLLADEGPGRGVAWGDVDDDGDPDLYVANRNVPNRIYRNDGGVFVDPALPLLEDPGASYAPVLGDYDGDGDLDLYVGNNGPNLLFRNEGTGAFTDVTQVTGASGGDVFTHGATWVDLDNDRDLDLYVANWNVPNVLLRNDGGVFAEVADAPENDDGPANGVAWADADADGDLDLYVTNGNAPNQLLRNDLAPGAGMHWLRVHLQGTISNRDGIGARVRVKTGTRWQVREISAGSGFVSQNEAVAAFGLGDANVVDTLEVRWPSGIVQRLAGVDADTELAVVEEAAVGIPGSEPSHDAAPATLLRVMPNPAARSLRIRYAVEDPGAASLVILDASGRLVRTLAIDASDALPGARAARWDLTDGKGRRVSPGIYFARLGAAGSVHTRRLVVLR